MNDLKGVTMMSPRKSTLALDHVFLIAMNMFDALFENHNIDFYLSTNLLTTSMELEDREWERILQESQSALEMLHKSNIREVAISCRNNGSNVTLSFCNPRYHDITLAEVVIRDKHNQKIAQAA